MSKKTDLLVRVRYENPLPPPPFPPKLLEIPTDLSRLGRPAYIAGLVRDTPFPMMVDAECGMPLDLLQYPSLWIGGDSFDINPTSSLPELDPKDEYLLAPPDPAKATTSSLTDAASATDVNSHVSWLGRTKYIAKDITRAMGTAEQKRPERLDRSIAGQQRLIEKTFEDLAKSDLASLKHPSKPNVYPIESYDVLPDPLTYATTYSLFKFTDPPSREAGPDGEKETSENVLSSAVIRPVLADGEQTLVYYLPSSEVAAIGALRALSTDVPEAEDPFLYTFARNYEVNVHAKTDAGKNLTDLALLISDGKPSGGSSSSPAGLKRPKGAFYHDYSGRLTLRKKRVKRNGPPAPPEWDEISLGLEDPSAGEMEQRKLQAAMLEDPAWKPPAEEDEDEAEAEAEAEAEGKDRPPAGAAEDEDEAMDVDG